ncbi:MAG: translation initiation factor IF-3 [Candidatus Moranbacteria bacterium]|nr:translation initiation factor IF-3 [Candidatus Moranbacteria bacterium]
MGKSHSSNRGKAKPNKARVNEQIKAPELRLIDENGGQLGVVSNQEAKQKASDVGLDLVEVSPNSQPPVVKIMDYGKFLYTKKKQERKNRVKSKKNEVKGIRLGINTEEHDLLIKRKRAEKFLKKGSKVQLELILKGREKAHRSKGRETMEEFVRNLELQATYDQPIKSGPRGLMATIKLDQKNSPE